MKRKLLILWLILIISSISLYSRDTIKIGSYENAPKIFTDKKGKVSGFWGEITNHISKKENWDVEWVSGSWPECLQRLESGEIDMLVDVAYTDARAEKYTFSDETVLMSWTRLYTSKNVKINTILDLEGKTIGCLKNSFNLTGPEGFKELVQKFEIDCKIIEMDSYIEVFTALDNNEVDAGITNKDFGQLHENNFAVKRTPIIFQSAKLLYAFNKNSSLTPKFKMEIDQNIKELKQNKNSILYQSIAKFMIGDKKIIIFPPWSKRLVAIIVIIIIFLITFIRTLKHQVNKKTYQMQQEIIVRKKTEEKLKREINDHKKAKIQIQNNLKEKTILLQELYHRTKNNMAVISSIISMQSGRSDNAFVKTTFLEINNKIKAMSLVHQKLYQAKDLSNINLKEYIEDLLKLIMQSYDKLSRKINIKFDLQNVKILIDSAIPIGLIINELITNIYKHAFPDNREGEIFICLFREEDETINLQLNDNGVGFPHNFDARKDGSLGLASVFSIVERQLKGKISVISKNGLKWHIIIKDNLHKERVRGE